MTETLTCQEAASRLGVSSVTIKTWLSTVFPGEPLRDSHGRRRVTPEQLKVLETIKALRQEDKGLATIQRIIGPVNFTEPSAESQPTVDRNAPEIQQPAIDVEALTRTITEQVTSSVVTSIQANTELAEKYARAAHQIGGLEQQVTHLTQQLQQANERILQLEAPKNDRPWWKVW